MNDINHESFKLVILSDVVNLLTGKIVPSVWNLFKKGHMSSMTSMIVLTESVLQLNKFTERFQIMLEVEEFKTFEDFLRKTTMINSNNFESSEFHHLSEVLNECGDQNRIFYLALSNHTCLLALSSIYKFCRSIKGWNRIVLERPFGSNEESYIDLSNKLESLFKKEDIFRLDHYLGKDSVLNLITLRFGNSIFYSSWNRKYINKVVISIKESFGIQGRGEYFDEVGIIRDMMQNHMMQILTLLTMDKPENLSEEAFHLEKIKLLKCIEEINYEDIVIGQYVGNPRGIGEERISYRNDPSIININSLTPTYANIVLYINNHCWKSVPFFLECGKGLNESKVEIKVHYKDVRNDIFSGQLRHNELIINIQPYESSSLSIMIKHPGRSSNSDNVHMSTPIILSEFQDKLGAHEKLILSIISGDHFPFVGEDEIKESWRIFGPLLKEIKESHMKPLFYQFGSVGPLSV